MDFIYTENTAGYLDLLSNRICDMPCKHVLNLGSEKAAKVWEESQKIGAMVNMWGYTSGIWKEPEKNRTVQMYAITRMVYLGLTMPFRVVIDAMGVPWIDNLHSAIRDIMVYGENVRLCDTSCYIMDLRGSCPVAVNVRNSLRDSISDIEGAVTAGYKRCGRVSDEIRKIGYTIGEFMEDNGINAKNAGIQECMVRKYKKIRAE